MEENAENSWMEKSLILVFWSQCGKRNLLHWMKRNIMRGMRVFCWELWREYDTNGRHFKWCMMCWELRLIEVNGLTEHRSRWSGSEGVNRTQVKIEWS